MAARQLDRPGSALIYKMSPIQHPGTDSEAIAPKRSATPFHSVFGQDIQNVTVSASDPTKLVIRREEISHDLDGTPWFYSSSCEGSKSGPGQAGRSITPKTLGSALRSDKTLSAARSKSLLTCS
jgi:hypothetical protein